MRDARQCVSVNTGLKIRVMVVAHHLRAWYAASSQASACSGRDSMRGGKRIVVCPCTSCCARTRGPGCKSQSVIAQVPAASARHDLGHHPIGCHGAHESLRQHGSTIACAHSLVSRLEALCTPSPMPCAWMASHCRVPSSLSVMFVAEAERLCTGILSQALSGVLTSADQCIQIKCEPVALPPQSWPCLLPVDWQS